MSKCENGTFVLDKLEMGFMSQKCEPDRLVFGAQHSVLVRAVLSGEYRVREYWFFWGKKGQMDKRERSENTARFTPSCLCTYLLIV